jgi:caffeoyl-CoA O-methyltransferase
MLTTADQAALLTMLTRLISARRAVEIGTFTGFSALAISRGLPTDGQLICLDASEEWTSIGWGYWERAGVASRIELRIGDGHELTAALDGSFDLAFVDADKPGYIDYFERLVPLIRPNGLLLFDNTLAGGRVVDADGPADRKEFNEHIAKDDRVDVVMLGIGDGLTLVRKK